jgi:hypothetical protein
MRCLVSYSALALALVTGASTAHTQTFVGGQYVEPIGPGVAAPAAPVAAPVEIIQTTQTVRSYRAAPLHPVRRQVVTTRIVTRQAVPTTPAVTTGTVATAPQQLYDTAVLPAAPAPAAAYAPAYDYGYGYGAPLYDAAPAAAVSTAIAPAPIVAAPVVAAPVVAAPVATQPVIYRYVYEPDRILVIDPVTNIAVQAIPR